MKWLGVFSADLPSLNSSPFVTTDCCTFMTKARRPTDYELVIAVLCSIA